MLVPHHLRLPGMFDPPPRLRHWPSQFPRGSLRPILRFTVAGMAGVPIARPLRSAVPVRPVERVRPRDPAV